MKKRYFCIFCPRFLQLVNSLLLNIFKVINFNDNDSRNYFSCFDFGLFLQNLSNNSNCFEIDFRKTDAKLMSNYSAKNHKNYLKYIIINYASSIINIKHSKLFTERYKYTLSLFNQQFYL